MAFTGPFRVRDMQYESGETHARHAHDELQISIVLRGSMREDSGGVSHHGTAGDIIIKPAGVMHSDAFDAARIVCLDADPSRVDVPFPRYAWHRATEATAAAVRLAHGFLDGTGIDEDLDDLLAAIPSAITPDRALATRAARALEDSFAHPPGIEDLAANLGVHRVHLARVFRLQWRCSPRDYIQQLRVRAAAHGLASTARALAEIAFETGFSDQAHMSRVFRRRMGMTPAAFRRFARA